MKRTLTASEKRTLRLGGIALGIYLVLFAGLRGASYFGQRRAEYQRLSREATELKLKLDLYQARGERVQRYMETFKMDPARLTNAVIIAQAGAEIQRLGASGGLMISSIRETVNRGSEPEVGSLQVDGAGPAAAIVTFLHNVRGCGFPVVIDSVQINGEPTRPGPLKVNLSILILNFDRWTEKGVPRG